MSVPDQEAAYCEGYRAGWLAGFSDGKSSGYVEAKTRARMALEAACDSLDVSRSQREVFMRTADAIVGKLT